MMKGCLCAPTSMGGLSMLGVGEGEWRVTVSQAPVSSREARNSGLLDRPSDFKNVDSDRAYFVWSKLSIFRS